MGKWLKLWSIVYFFHHKTLLYLTFIHLSFSYLYVAQIQKKQLHSPTKTEVMPISKATALNWLCFRCVNSLHARQWSTLFWSQWFCIWFVLCDTTGGIRNTQVPEQVQLSLTRWQKKRRKKNGWGLWDGGIAGTSYSGVSQTTEIYCTVSLQLRILQCVVLWQHFYYYFSGLNKPT